MYKMLRVLKTFADVLLLIRPVLALVLVLVLVLRRPMGLLLVMVVVVVLLLLLLLLLYNSVFAQPSSCLKRHAGLSLPCHSLHELTGSHCRACGPGIAKADNLALLLLVTKRTTLIVCQCNSNKLELHL
jgi:hypothetical protein